MASVPQQMQQNMVFAAAPQMTATPQGPLLIAPGQTMGQPMNGQIPQYIQTGYPAAGFVTQTPNQFISMGSYPVMVNGFQQPNQVQNLAIQIPQNNAQQMIATTPTQMAPQNVGQKSGPKGQQMQSNQQGMMKTPVTANKSLHPGQQMQQAPQNGQQQMLQQGTYFVASNGQAFHAVPAQPTPPQQQQNQNSNKKNTNVKAQKQTPQPPKPIQIQPPMIQPTYKPGQGMPANNMQPTQAIQFANSNGQPIMFSQMQPAQTIWGPQPVQQGQFAVAAQPQQVVLRSPGGDQTAMVLQQPSQSQYQMPVQIQGQQQQQPGTPTMQINPQQPVIQIANGTYTQVATATTPTTPTKSVMIQPKIQQNQEITPKAAAKIPVKLVPNNASAKAENTPAKLAPKIVPTPTSTASGPQSGPNVSQKSIGTHAPRSSFPSIGSHPPTNQSKHNVRSVQTATNTPITRTVNTQVSKKLPEKRSQGTGNSAVQNVKKEDIKSKNDIVQHFVDGMIVLESKQPFPCEQDVDVKSNNNNNNIKVKDLKGEQKENITTQTINTPKGKPQNVTEVNGKNEKKFPDPKTKTLQNGIKFPPIASKPLPQNIPPAPKVSTSKSVSTGTGTTTIAGNKRPATKPEFKGPEKKPSIQTSLPASVPVNSFPVAVQQSVAPVPVPAPVPQPPAPESKDSQTNGNNNDSNDGNNAPNLWLPANNTNPKSWTVDDVCEFIAHIDGCAQYADQFRSEEIDGQALMLIKEKHIVEILKTKWGMALKIHEKIEELKTAFHISF